MVAKTRADDGDAVPHITRAVPTWGINSTIGAVAAAFVAIYNGQTDTNKALAEVKTKVEVLTVSSTQRDKEITQLQSKADETTRRIDVLERTINDYLKGNGNGQKQRQ